MKKRTAKFLVYVILAIVGVLVIVGGARAASGYVDPVDRWAWGTNIGWINFSPADGGVTVYDDHLEGYAWAENVGWIRMGTYEGGGAHTYTNDAPTTYGVNNDGAGNLSGYAWGTNIGWINFDPTHGGVTIDQITGEFDGYAWGENVGWIHFKDTGANPYSVVVATSLTVVKGGVVADKQQITNGAVLYGNIDKISVTFNKDVSNPAGSGGADDVTNPANYLLFQSGADGVYDTVDCATVPGVHANDVAIPVGLVTYSNAGGSGPFIATLSVNNGIILPTGEYRLLVCGTTSIVDLNGVALAGDGVTSGTDMVRTFSIAESTLPATGFPKGCITSLLEQPAVKTYEDTAMTLEVPALNISTQIINVPHTIDGWDVTWLGNNAGYLAGSAFPTWEGNTVITGHVWDIYNQPGVFADLNKLSYGDLVQIQAWGQTYTYEVRESKLVGSGNVGAVLQSEDYDWLTLVTCEFYNPFNETYFFRRMVRAVLVDVK